MANEVNELFVGTAKRKSIVAKHEARTSWARTNLDEVVRFLQLDVAHGWKVYPLIVVDQPLVASYLRESSIPVTSFEELKRFWPEIRRA
jgi:hypothetical protein